MSTGTRIDGKAKAASLSTLIRAETETLRNDTGIVPGLTVVIVGDDPASQVYVRNKQRTAQACGFRSEQHALPADTTEDKLLALIESLNNDDSVHGILVQLPLPKHLDEQRVTQAIVPSKDVDGFHYVNIGKLSAGESRAAFVPCTPAGCMLMIEDQLGADLSGKSAVVIGRSNIVGKPMASLLLAANATVTVAHSRTRDLPGLCRQADIVVAAVGRPQMVKGDWVKPGAVVIDVGINRVETSVDGETRSRLIGDVDYDAVIDHAAAVTPVPGGVGPMTIAMLMSNTLRAAKFAAAKIQPLPGPTQADDAFRTIWLSPGDDSIVQIIDQRRLPHEYVVADLRHWQDGLAAISDMAVRGAPLIGATAAWSLYLAARSGGHDEARQAADVLAESRPTAVNLRWAIQRMLARLESATTDEATVASMRAEAEAIVAEDVEISLGIGRSGLDLIRALANNKNGPVNILTHCNAGALATINWGTATAPVYLAHREGIDVHVWVDETRPRNQGSQLTAWELDQRGVPHTLIVDNAGGHLMQHGEVDLVITGTDRTTRHGDVANKIGTYLKALAAHDNGIPFYVALPSTTIDWSIRDGVREIPIEQRDPREVTHIYGDLNGRTVEVNTTAGNTRASNYAFDVTPARLVSGLITERGVCPASEAGLLSLFPEHGDKQ